MEIQVGNLPRPLRKKDISEKLVDVCGKNDIVFMAIFGSFVRKEQNSRSDIDIAIEFDKKKRKSLLDLVRVENELTEIFGRKVDVGIFSRLSPHVAKDVEREMRLIYEKR